MRMSDSSGDFDKIEAESDFDGLLETIDAIPPKERFLWKQIYLNAVKDRNNANMCFMNLYPSVAQDKDSHAINGTQLRNYLERMEKSNEQLLKLATLIDKVKERTMVATEEEEVDFDSLFEKMNKEKKEK